MRIRLDDDYDYNDEESDYDYHADENNNECYVHYGDDPKAS